VNLRKRRQPVGYKRATDSGRIATKSCFSCALPSWCSSVMIGILQVGLRCSGVGEDVGSGWRCEVRSELEVGLDRVDDSDSEVSCLIVSGKRWEASIGCVLA
jgi:hypothetical protein